MTGLTVLVSLLRRTTQPDEIYNLAAQSHVKVSFELPEYTAAASGMVSDSSVHRLLYRLQLNRYQGNAVPLVPEQACYVHCRVL